MSNHPLQKAFNLIPRVLRLFLLPFRDALIDFRGLSLSLKILALLGYLGVFVLLGLALLVELLYDNLPMTTYLPTEEIGMRQIPFPVIVISGLSFALSWAYILTGATDCRRRVFVPLIALAFVQLFLFLPQGNVMVVWFCTAPPLVIGVVVTYFLTRGRRYWRDFPLVEFFFWLMAMLFYVLLFFFSYQTNDALADALHAVSSLFSMLTIPLWFFFGLAVVDMAVSVARGVVTTLRRLFPGEFLGALTVCLILIRPALALFAIAMNGLDTRLGQVFFLDALVTVLPLTMLMIVLALLRRWNARNMSIVLALSIVIPIFILGLMMTVEGQDISDPLGLALERLGLFPPLLLFVALMVYGVLGTVSSFANKEGTIVPRSGRILLGFGFVLLIISLTLFSVNVRDVASGQLDPSFEQALDAFFGLSVFLLGLPYLAWIIWRRRDRLAGVEKELAGKEPLFAWLGKASGRIWLALGITATIFLSCVICLVSLIFGAPAS
ncbi:MAG: hypothetical protein JW900_02530 [Anaerolineae bacterium]|nr:hypothetical protein [Anaerolineae bacterium]